MPSESKKYYMYFILYADCIYMYLDFLKKKNTKKSIYFLLVVGAGGIVFVISIAIIMMVKR